MAACATAAAALAVSAAETEMVIGRAPALQSQQFGLSLSPSQDFHQPVHSPCLIRVFPVHMKIANALSY